MTPNTLTDDQKADAKAEAKKAAAKLARAEVAAAKEALDKANLAYTHKKGTLTIDVVDNGPLTPEQRKRAATYTAGHGGLAGKALALFILEGKTLKEQTADAQAAKTAAKKAEKARVNLTRSNDPEAKALAEQAAALVPDVVSTFRPKNARELLDTFTVAMKGAIVVIGRENAQGVEGALEAVDIEVGTLEAFVKAQPMDDEVKRATRKQISGLAKGTGLWGRKLAALLLAKAAQ